ncbi:Prephenate dehydratase-domain-containing protein [Mycena capillaripes]|nr:Prephenate dehydratase-domain-containing protein [Mycena capillaripes]
MHEKARPRRVAYLGPLGTYSHQAAYDRFDVFNAVASQNTHAGVVPQENSIFGSVIETYDALRRQDVGFIQGEIVLEVQHCLLVRRGVKHEDIQCIKSHEQALGQCRGFLARHFPSASLEKVASTAAAAQAVLTSSDAAAICSRLCATVFDGLEILFEGIQDRDSAQFHAFLCANSGARRRVAAAPCAVPDPTRCLVRLSSRSDLESPAPAITQLLAALAMPVSRLDRRPRLESPVPFHDVYFAELERGDSGGPWPSDIEQSIDRVRAAGGEAELLGIW